MDGKQPQKDLTGAEKKVSTQSTQYDKIGLRYNGMHNLPAVQPEKPSVIAALGDIRGKKCLDLACGTGRYTNLLSTLGAASVDGYDISTTMIQGAQSSYPSTTHPTLHFAVADCSQPENLPSPPNAFDIVFAGWFLNYAGTQRELTNMLRVIASQLTPSGGRFVGITTNARDPAMQEPRLNFYGAHIDVLDKEYKDPETGEIVGVKARVIADTEPVVQFDVFQFTQDVYEKCAKEAGLALAWRDVLVPDDERKEGSYWDRYLERPTFNILEARRL